MGKLGKIIGARIEEARTSRKLSRETIASSVDMDSVTLYRIERDKQGTTLETIEQIAAAIGIPPEALLNREAMKVDPDPQTAWQIVGKALTERRETPTQGPPSLSIPGIDSAKLDELAALLTKRPKAINGVLNALRGRGDVSDKAKDSG